MITSTSASTKLNVLYVEFNLDEKITINMNQQMYPSLMASTENGKGWGEGSESKILLPFDASAGVFPIKPPASKNLARVGL